MVFYIRMTYECDMGENNEDKMLYELYTYRELNLFTQMNVKTCNQKRKRKDECEDLS